ncbi:MAG: trypsin-like peptidase domain-containing protein [Lachnospiraceae bacterium]|nr:trypsin-like peptidase domain-containing protein [Lachnospiraceae bacterium]
MDDRDQRNNHHNRPMFALLLLLTLLIIVGGIYLGAAQVRSLLARSTVSLEETEEESQTDTDTDTEAESASNENAEGGLQENAASGQTLDVVEVVKKAMPSVVAVTNKSVQEMTTMFRESMEIESVSSGSGIIIGQNDTELLIATNYHVIQGASTLSVIFSVETDEETTADAVMKGSDEEYDLAVIAVVLEDIPDEVREAIGIAELGSSGALVIGEPAVAIGNALGYGQSVTSGIVSALNRSLEIDGVTREYIQTDAAINAGNSGGALLNAQGEVIGINSAKVASSGVEGMGYAIPIDEAKPVLSALMERETRTKPGEDERGYLGAYTQDVSTEARSLYDIPNGVYVTYVADDSPAEDAGLQQGDIICEMDGVTISSTEGFEELLEYYRAGETVSMEILRASRGDYTSRTLSVTFSEQPENSGSGPQNTQPFDSRGPFR